LETETILITQALVRQNTLETAVNGTVDLSTQALADSGGNLSIPLFVAGFIVGPGLGLSNGRGRRSSLVIEDLISIR
jgi:hypothetical protein